MAERRPWKTLRLEGPDATGIAQLILNRPEKLNALNDEVFTEIPLALEKLDSNSAVRVVVVSGSGPHFCAGIDLGNTFPPPSAEGGGDVGRERERLRRSVLHMQDAFTSFERCRKPVIAAIHGACIGGGIDLITACDLRYSTEDAFFSVKEVDLAITADLGTLQRLPHVIGYSKTMELALTARKFAASEAKCLGLVHGVFPSKEELSRGVASIASEIASKPPLAVLGTKAVLLQSRDTTVRDGLDYVATWNSAMLVSDDVTEALQARREKRVPKYSKL